MNRGDLMKSFKEFDFKTFYSKTDSDLAEDFFIPCMENASSYDRITGFFGSSIYIIIWGALKTFVNNGGHIRILCSPRISKEDREAINEGLQSKDSPILVEALKKELDAMFSLEELEQPARILATLIATGVIEIKIVTTDYEEIPFTYRSMFHDKIGIFTDYFGNIVSFGGSMNETYLGLSSNGNSETVSVNISWDPGRDGQRTTDYSELFEDIWNKRVSKIKIHDFPSDIKEVFRKYSSESELQTLLEEITIRTNPRKTSSFKVGPYILRSYQKDAYTLWVNNGRRGILKHATGSGKTITGMFCIKKSLESNEIPVIIVPSLDLQRQWMNNIQSTMPSVQILLCGGMDSISWKKQLATWSASGDGHRIIIAVINTVCCDAFLARFVQGNHIFILADEVHRLGSVEFRKSLTINSGARLWLSATPARYRDADGTAVIFDYFGPIVHTFDLVDAIESGNLTKYYYYPVPVHLNSQESDEWKKLSLKLSRAISYSKDSNPFDDEAVKQILIKRSRIAKNAAAKVDLAVEIIKTNYHRGERWLIYCDNINQLEQLWTKLDLLRLDSYKYYSSMPGDRESTLNYFNDNGGILISIKCLDEGVDIPTVSHALIIASSQNPREHIQRRGRVLRKSPDKIYSYIYDLVVVPEFADSGNHFDSLTWSELSRAIKFGEYAVNRDTCVTDLRIIAIDNDIDPDSAFEEGYEEDNV